MHDMPDNMLEWLKGAEIPDREKQVMRLRLEGLSYRAIGDRIGRSAERVRSILAHIHRLYLRDNDAERAADGARGVIAAMNLSVRTRNCLMNAGFENFSEVTAMSDEELLSIRSLGETSLAEIRTMESMLRMTARGADDYLRKLNALIEAVESGRDNSELWFPALGDHGYKGMQAFHGSVDAFLALKEALLPKWDYLLDNMQRTKVLAIVQNHGGAEYWGQNACPARAGLLAILRACRDKPPA